MAAASTGSTLLVGANFALLTAGAAATIYLWLRVFSPDAAILPVPAENAAVAFARSSIAAEIDLTLQPASRPQPETVAFGGGRGAPASPAAGSRPSPSRIPAASPADGIQPERAGGSLEGGSGGPVVRPSPPPPPPPPPEEPPAPRPARHPPRRRRSPPHRPTTAFPARRFPPESPTPSPADRATALPDPSRAGLSPDALDRRTRRHRRGVALGFAGLLLLRDDGPEELLPDLDQAVPSELAIVQEGDTYRLTFASAVDNVGRGPLLIAGERPDLSVRVMEAQQVVRSSDGSTRERSVERDPLRPLGDARALAPARLRALRAAKRRGRRARGPRLENRLLPGRPVRDGPRHGARGRAGPAGLDGGVRSAAAGSPDGARGDLAGVRRRLRAGARGPVPRRDERPAGRYLLVHRANPDRTLEESDYDNAASVLIQLRRTTGVIPAVRVLAVVPTPKRARLDRNIKLGLGPDERGIDRVGLWLRWMKSHAKERPAMLEP